MRVACAVLGHRKTLFQLHVPIGAYALQHTHIICAGQKKRVVDRHQHAAIVDQRSNLVDQLDVVVFQVNYAFVAGGKKRRVEKHAVEAFALAVELADLRPKVAGLKIGFVDLENTRKVLLALCHDIPNGIFRWISDFPGLSGIPALANLRKRLHPANY